MEAALTHLNQVEALDSNRIGNCTTDFFDYCAEDGTDDVSGVIPVSFLPSSRVGKSKNELA